MHKAIRLARLGTDARILQSVAKKLSRQETSPMRAQKSFAGKSGRIDIVFCYGQNQFAGK
jgi:hypothetical protein